MSKLVSSLQFLLCGGLTLSSASAQSVTGTISGVVSDPNGAIVVGATVVVKNAATNAEARGTTDGIGSYRLSNLVPGEYVIEVDAPGFQKTTTPPQRLSTGDSLRVDVPLEIVQVTESVTVRATALEVNTEDAQLGKTFRDVSEVPLLSGGSGRNVLTLLGTQPGVVVNPNDAYSVNGQRAGSNNFMLDGGDSTNVANSLPDAVNAISPNAIAEFRLVSGAMKAEYGRNSGGIVVVSTKSGGNSFHGVASETFRNTRLNAVPFFSKSFAEGTAERFADGTSRKPQWNGNDFDANLGGPIRKDQTFFFVSYLGFRRRLGEARPATLPSDAERAAIEAGGTPEAKGLLAQVPRALSGNSFLSAPMNSLDRNQGVAKIDHLFSRANRVAVTYFLEDQSGVSPFGGQAAGMGVPGFGLDTGARWQNLILRDTHAFSPTLFQEFRASFHRNANANLTQNRISLSSLGLGKIVPDDRTAEGPPNVSIGGFTTFGNPTNSPLALQRSTFHLLDNVSWTHSRHSPKFGGEFLSNIVHSTFDNTINGRISIDGSGTASRSSLIARVIPGLEHSPQLNDFANGFASTFEQGISRRGVSRTRSLDLFLQDDWKLRPNLTLNPGLRWEYFCGPTDAEDRFLAWRPGRQSIVFPDAPAGVVYPGDAGISRSTLRDDLNNFAPRFGVAWDVLKSGKLSLRGGYGLLYDSPSAEFGAAFLNAPPFVIRPSVRVTRYANPWEASLVNPIPQPFPFQPPRPGGRFDFTKVAPINLGLYDPDFATPYTQQWNLQLQYQVYRDWLVDVGYVGSNGVRLLSQRQVNTAIPGPGATNANTDSRRVFNQSNPLNAQYGGAVFGRMIAELTDANSNYHSLQVNVSRRFANGFQMSHAYTWGHAIDNTSLITWTPGFEVTTRTDNARADRGNSASDVRHRYVATYIYELPWMKSGRGALSRVLGGWGISGITTFQAGLPFNITEPQDRCLCDSGAQRPEYIGGKVRFFDPRAASAVFGRPNSWFDGTGAGSGSGAPNPYLRRVGSAQSFAAGAGRFGNLGRNVFHGPGINNWDLSLFKRMPVSEGHRLEIRVEFLNAFNHTQFSNPNGNIQNTANFGRITLTRDPRIVQLVLRYAF